MSKIKRRLMTLLITLGIIVAVLFGIGYLVLHSPSFGALPSGARLERIQHSPNYRDGRFQNRYPMPQAMQTSSMGDRIKILWKFLFDRPDDIRPVDSIPVVRHDLKKLDRSEDLIVWFGHSGYLLQMDGVRYLIDPVFVEGAPFGISNAFFKGTQVFDVADLPEIDYLVISHDHWDHLDYHVAKELQSRVRKVYTGLGVGAHLERWGYRPDQIVELDWGESTPTAEGGRVHCLPTQHFSGRGLTHAQSLWASFVLQGPKHSVYVGGDGGFGPHYAEIGKQSPNWIWLSSRTGSTTRRTGAASTCSPSTSVRRCKPSALSASSRCIMRSSPWRCTPGKSHYRTLSACAMRRASPS